MEREIKDSYFHILIILGLPPSSEEPFTCTCDVHLFIGTRKSKNEKLPKTKIVVAGGSPMGASHPQQQAVGDKKDKLPLWKKNPSSG